MTPWGSGGHHGANQCPANYDSVHGRPLSPADAQQVRQLRQRLAAGGRVIPAGYDTDFNLFRWLLGARHCHRKCHEAGRILDEAEAGLRAHLKFREIMQLDAGDIPTMEDNPLFAHRFLPGGKLAKGADARNRILYFLQQKSLDLHKTTEVVRSSEIIVWQLQLFEHLLRLVNERERATGRMSAVHQLVDMTGYHMGPIAMLFVNNGQLAYYARLLHYEHYPELLTPVETCHSGTVVALAYRLIKQAMPHGFADRFRVSAGAPSAKVLACIEGEDLPDYFGGLNKDLCSTSTCHSTMASFQRQEPAPPAGHPFHLHLGAGRVSVTEVVAKAKGDELRWRFSTDGDVYFGVFEGGVRAEEVGQPGTLDRMVHAWFKLCAKLVPEAGSVALPRAGAYTMAVGNAHSWITTRNVHISASVGGEPVHFEKAV